MQLCFTFDLLVIIVDADCQHPYYCYPGLYYYFSTSPSHFSIYIFFDLLISLMMDG